MPQIGDIVYLHDHDTNASGKNVMRWCMIVAVNGSRTRVAPRSSTVRGPIFTPAGLLAEFDLDGWFSRWTVPVATAVVEEARNIGQLPEPARSEVLRITARRKRRAR